MEKLKNIIMLLALELLNNNPFFNFILRNLKKEEVNS